MDDATGSRPTPRRRSAADRDARILGAIRERLVEDPDSSMAELATAAAVGMSAIYSRFGDKDALLQRLAREGGEIWESALEVAEGSLERGTDPWAVVEDFLRTAEAADVMALGALLYRRTPVREDERRRRQRLSDRGDELIRRLHAAGALRSGVTSQDLAKVLEAAGAVRGDGPERTRALKARMLDISIEGLRPHLPPLRGMAAGPRDM